MVMINTSLQVLLIYLGTDHIQFSLMTSLDFEMVTIQVLEKADWQWADNSISSCMLFKTVVNKDLLDYYIRERRTFPTSVHTFFVKLKKE